MQTIEVMSWSELGAFHFNPLILCVFSKGMPGLPGEKGESGHVGLMVSFYPVKRSVPYLHHICPSFTQINKLMIFLPHYIPGFRVHLVNKAPAVLKDLLEDR